MGVWASEAPELNDEQVDNVDAILAFVKATSVEDAKVVLNFDHLITNENMRNILGYKIPISDLPFLKDRKGKAQKPREDPTPTTLKGKEKVSDGSKKSKEPKEVPKTVKKLLADAQRIGAEQEAKAKKAVEKKKAAELKAAEKSAEKSKAFQERPHRTKRRKGKLLGKDQGSRRHGRTLNRLVRRLRVFPFASSPWQSLLPSAYLRVPRRRLCLSTHP
jgi:hypothetical protein